MLSKPNTILLFAKVVAGTSSRRLAWAIVTLFLGSTSAAWAQYDFLTVTGNGTGQGNAATSQFTSPNGLGVIHVTHAFAPIGPGIGPALNDNNNSLLFPSGFPTLFPGSGQVQGHLAQTEYGKTINGVPTNSTSTVTFNLSNYTWSNTVFGIWNTTTEVPQPVYRVEVLANNVWGPPTTFVPFGSPNHEDNTLQPAPFDLTMNLATGDITPGGPIGQGHTDAAFWTIPSNAMAIRVLGNLPVFQDTNPLPDPASRGDGVGYYFAELCPSDNNLAALIANDGMLCNGDKKFTDFAYHPIGDMPDASLIDVVSFTDSQGNLGIRFIGPFTDQFGGGASEALLEYKVTVTDPDQLINDVHLSANTNVVGNQGYAMITETFLPEDPQVVLEVYDLEPGGRQLTDWADLTTPVMMLHVQKDITLFAADAGSLATISFIDQSFSQVPEPASWSLVLSGVILWCATRRLRGVGGHVGRMSTHRTSSVVALCLMGSLTAIGWGVPITVTSSPLVPPNCEPAILPPANVDELGTIAFPANELITATHTFSNVFACQPSPVASVQLDITNTVIPPVAFTDLWYVASHDTTFSNHEMLVENQQAMKIDSLGPHQPLVFESANANNIFEPGETWSFILDDWRNNLGFLPSQLNTPGMVGFLDTASSGSIIAIPEPGTCRGIGMAVLGLAVIRRGYGRSHVTAS